MAGLCVCSLLLLVSAMAAESRGKPKIKGAAWRRPHGTGSTAGGE